MDFRDYKDGIIDIIKNWDFDIISDETIFNDEYFLIVTTMVNQLQISFEGYMRPGDTDVWWNLDLTIEITPSRVVKDVTAIADKTVDEIFTYIM